MTKWSTYRRATNSDWAGLLGMIAGLALLAYLALRIWGWP